MSSAGLDHDALLQALDSRRQQHALSWRQAALAAGVDPTTLHRIRTGSRPDLDNYIRLVDWLGVPADQFIRRGQLPPPTTARAEPHLLAELRTVIRAHHELSPDTRSAIEKIVDTAVTELTALRAGPAATRSSLRLRRLPRFPC